MNRSCLHCRGPLVRANPQKRWPKFCSTACVKRRIQVLEPRQHVVCPECEDIFLQKQHGQVFCCILHQRRYRNRIRMRARRAAGDNGRSRGMFDPLVVLDRDGWSCYLCGDPTPRDLRGTVHPRAPEIDHIVPKSRGGLDSYENTRACCRRCNLAKGSKLLETYLSRQTQKIRLLELTNGVGSAQGVTGAPLPTLQTGMGVREH